MPKEILVVESNHKIRRMVGQILELEDYKVWPAGNGREALRLLYRHKEIAVILFEYRSWVPGDREFVDNIRSDEKLRLIPRLCITGDTSVEKLPNLAEIAQDYLIKPFDNEVLYEKLGRLLEEEKQGPQV